jgi:hypothetical protein
MPNPSVQLTIQDPGLGQLVPSAGRTQVKLGVTQKGTPNVLVSAGSDGALKEAIGNGKVADAASQVLNTGGSPVLVMPVTITADGTVSANLTLTGSGTGTIAAARGPEAIARIKIIAGGALGTATFQTALGASGAFGPTVATTVDPFTYRIPGQRFTKAVFGNVVYTANDIYQFNLDGTVTRTGAGPATALDTSVHSPLDDYDLWVEITTAGALGAGAFRYSLDGGNNWVGSFGIPAGGKFVVPGTGIVLTFAGTFTLGDLYKGTSTAAGYDNTELTNALVALRADPSRWGFLHVVGTPANAAGALSLAAAVGAQLTAMEAEKKYRYGIVECPQTEGDATLKTTFADYADTRVAVCAGDVDLLSTLTGRRHRRNLAWAYSAKRSAQLLSVHPGQVAAENGGGPLKNVLGLYRNETTTPGLDDARFVTAGSLEGTNGFYVIRGRMMAPAGSDYDDVMARAVMDRACEIAEAAHLEYLNKRQRIDRVTGKIDERDAQDMEANVRSKLESGLVGEDEASAIEYTVSRTDNLLSTSTINTEVGVVPFGYSEFIKVKIGFVNPALRAAAA